LESKVLLLSEKYMTRTISLECTQVASRRLSFVSLHQGPKRLSCLFFFKKNPMEVLRRRIHFSNWELQMTQDLPWRIRQTAEIQSIACTGSSDYKMSHAARWNRMSTDVA